MEDNSNSICRTIVTCQLNVKLYVLVIGLLYGTSGALLSLCVYVYDGSPNLCANAQNITFFAWSFKIIFAIITDIYRPFGLRRRPWMIFGWIMTLLLLLILAITADKLDASSWLAILLLVQFFAMFSGFQILSFSCNA